jgi:hypothetical protein
LSIRNFNCIKKVISYTILTLILISQFLFFTKSAEAIEPIEIAQSLKDRFKNQSKNVVREKRKAGKLFLKNVASFISFMRTQEYIELNNLPSSANNRCFQYTHASMYGGSWGVNYGKGVFYRIVVGDMSNGDVPKILPVGNLEAGKVLQLKLNPREILSERNRRLFRLCKIEFDSIPNKKGIARGKFYMSVPTSPPSIVEGNWEKEGRDQLSQRFSLILRPFKTMYGVLINHKDGLINQNKFYRDNWKYDLRTLEDITKYVSDNKNLCYKAHTLSRTKGASFRCNSIKELSYATRMKNRGLAPKARSVAPKPRDGSSTVSILKDGVAPPKEQTIKNAIKFNWKNKSYYVTHKRIAGDEYTWVFHKNKELTQGQKVATLQSFWVNQLKAEVKRQSSSLRATAPKSPILAPKSSGGWIGVNIQTVTPKIMKDHGLNTAIGAFVNGVTKYGPAASSGIRITDIILKFNNQPITEIASLVKIISQSKVNYTFKVEVWRDRKKQIKIIRVAPRPKEFKYSNGDRYLGDLKNNIRHGLGKYTYANGTEYIGYWQNGKMYGLGTLTYKNGAVKEGTWKNGKLVSSTK